MRHARQQPRRCGYDISRGVWLNHTMWRSRLALVFLVGCTEVANPAYCDENSDCRNGNVCNLSTHGCELGVPGDAAADGLEPDGPFVARTIEEVRAPTTPADTPVALTDVVVTAIDRHGVRVGDVWVQDAFGIPYGVHVYGAVDADVASLDVGDTIDITNARKLLYTLGGDTTGRAEIEVVPVQGGILEITQKGTGTVRTTALDIEAIAAMSQPQRDQEIEKLAGMLVRAASVRADGAPQMMPTFREFTIGPFHVQDQQTDFPSGIDETTCFLELTGIIEYARNYNLVPRSESDLAIGGSCP